MPAAKSLKSKILTALGPKKAKAPKASKKAPAKAKPVVQASKKTAKKVAQQTTASSKKAAGKHSAAEAASKSASSVCREVACDLSATTGGYCRMHYIKNWKKIKRKELILKEKKLNRYIEELVSKYPDKYIEAIRQDLASEKDFAKVVSDLEIEEGLDDFESDSDTTEGLLDNFKREVEDDGDIF
ncbi:MAG: hypothetical protein AB7F43_08300 [Bacteriovoracia bacterium]